jgi:DNA polymerase (family 10)
MPEGVLEMLTIPGLRPEKILKLHETLGLTSLAELEQAAKAGRLRAVKGLGAALETKILQGIDMRRNSEGQRHLHRAEELLRSAERHLRSSLTGITRVTPAGAFRRGCELVGELALVVEMPAREYTAHDIPRQSAHRLSNRCAAMRYNAPPRDRIWIAY